MALPLATIAATVPSSQATNVGYAFALVLYAAGSLICHQRPERSFHLLGTQMPVCARCTGIYAGAAITAVAVIARSVTSHASPLKTRRLETSDLRRILLVSAVPTAVTLVYEWTTGQTPGNWIRAMSGVPLGAAVAWMVCSVR